MCDIYLRWMGRKLKQAQINLLGRYIKLKTLHRMEYETAANLSRLKPGKY